ncbi:hypothetical protein JW877_08240 [bacterium]|nr:hypothetical protein [bacterium]
MMKAILLVFYFVLFFISISWGGVSLIPTDLSQANLISAYQFAIDHAINSWHEQGDFEPSIADPYGEIPILWSAGDHGASYGHFLFPAPLSESFSSRFEAFFDLEMLEEAYSINYTGSPGIAIFKSSLLDAFGQTVSWEYYYFQQFFTNTVSLDLGGNVITVNEASIASMSHNVRLLIIPAFEYSDPPTAFMDSIITLYPEIGTTLRNFLGRGGMLYTEGNAAYFLEAAGIIPSGSVDFTSTVDGPDLALAGIQFVEDAHPLALTRSCEYLYTIMGPTLDDALRAIVRFTSTSDPADSGKTAVACIEGAEAFGGRIVINAGMPAVTTLVPIGEPQWQWVANALLYAFSEKLMVIRSIFTDADIESTDIAPMALPVDDQDTFQVTIRLRNLSSSTIYNITHVETKKEYFDYAGVVAGPTPSVAGNAITFELPALSPNSEQTIVYLLATPPIEDPRVENIDSYLDYSTEMRVSSCMVGFQEPVTLNERWTYRNSLWAQMLFNARIEADADLNWKNILGEYFQPFKIFMIMENKERTEALHTRYVQYIPLDVPIYWVDEMSIPIIRTPGGTFVDILKGSESLGSVTFNMDSDADPDAWLDRSTIHPYPDSLILESIYWLNPWSGEYEDIDGDGNRAEDTDGDGIVDITEPGDEIRAYRAVWNIETVPGYQFYDPYASWELWIDPPPLVQMAVGAAIHEGTGYIGPDSLGDSLLGSPIYYYEGWDKWMEKDHFGEIVIKRLVLQNIESYEGFAFVDSGYILREAYDTDLGWVPYPRREYIAVLNLGGEEPTMTRPTPENSLYSNIFYRTVWGKERTTPIRTTYTYYTPLPNPLQFEYISKTFAITDPSSGALLQYLPGHGSANLSFQITASTEYSYYWIVNVGQDFGTFGYGEGVWQKLSDTEDGLGDGVFGYIIENIPKGIGGYQISLPMLDDSTYDLAAIVPDFYIFEEDDPDVGTEVEVWEFPFYYSVYIPQILIPPALDDDNFDFVDDWLDDKGDRFVNSTGYLHDKWPQFNGEYAESLYDLDPWPLVEIEGDLSVAHPGWYPGLDGEYGDDLCEKLGEVKLAINAHFQGAGREGLLKINDGAWLVNEEIFGGSPWVQFSHAQSAYAIANDVRVWRKGDPTLISLFADTVYMKYLIYDWGSYYGGRWTEPHEFDVDFDPWVQSFGYRQVALTTHIGGKEPLGLFEPDITTSARIDPDYDIHTVNILPWALGDSLLEARGYPSLETGAFLQVVIEVDNASHGHWYNTRIMPDLSGLGSTNAVLWYACYPRPLVPAHVDPATGEVIEEGDDPRTFHAGWRFNPSTEEVWLRIGESDGSALIPEIQASRRGYYVFHFLVDPALEPNKVHEINFVISGEERAYFETVTTPFGPFEVPGGKFAIVNRDGSGRIIEDPRFVIGQAQLNQFQTQLEDYVEILNPASDVRWCDIEPNAGMFDTLPAVSALVSPANQLSIGGIPYSSGFPLDEDNTEYWLVAKALVEIEAGGDDIPLDGGARVNYYDFQGSSRYASTSPIQVAARGPKFLLTNLISEVNGEPVEERGHFILTEGQNFLTASLICRNIGNDIGFEPVITVVLGDEVELDSVGGGFIASPLDGDSLLTITGIPHIPPGQARNIPVYINVGKVDGVDVIDLLWAFTTEYAYYRVSGSDTTRRIGEAMTNDTLRYSLDLYTGNNDFTLSNAEPAQGEEIILNLKVHHYGQAPVKDVVVRFSENDLQIGEDQIIENLNFVDSVATVSVPFTVTGYFHRLIAVVDPEGQFGESNENNNSALFEIIVKGGNPIQNLVNWPNPFQDYTEFVYLLTVPAMDVTIKIYTESGRLIKTIKHASANFGYNYEPWDGRDDDGDQIANGTYIYKIIVKTSEKTYEVNERAIRMR